MVHSDVFVFNSTSFIKFTAPEAADVIMPQLSVHLIIMASSFVSINHI